MRISIVALLLPLAACAPTYIAPPPVFVEPPMSGGGIGICNTAGLGSFVGQVVTPELSARMVAASGARVVRVIGPGMAVTMDHSDARLNIHVDRNNRVLRTDCG
ncbi:MAG TPA: I78 family peptidase inhibitor [Sphingomicrobium sp.]|nr:I78 family peptidase inhibitor [Sphingomicrobium sp.]